MALAATVVRKGRFAVTAKVFRVLVVLLSVALFTYLFIDKSVSKFLKDSLTVQIINKLPQPLDFYLVKIDSSKSAAQPYQITHPGKIRTDHYRLEYLKMEESNEFWVAGYLGKKQLVYFSQHSVPNKNQDQIIEVQNYINQSMKLSDIAKSEIDEVNFQNMIRSIWITLSFLLLFLNIVLIVRRK